MSDKIDLFNKRLVDCVEQTMLLMSKSGKELINAVVKNVVFKINAPDLVDFKPSAIYRAKKTFKQNREKVIKLSGLYSPLFGREKGKPEQPPFSLIVNVDDESLKQGMIWY
ncbi:hypothetical protein FZI32_21765, partial [Cronobacter sakazakii]